MNKRLLFLSDRCAIRFEGHVNRQQPVGAAFSPCMRYIASGSEDKLAYLFDIRSGTYVERYAFCLSVCVA